MKTCGCIASTPNKILKQEAEIQDGNSVRGMSVMQRRREMQDTEAGIIVISKDNMSYSPH